MIKVISIHEPILAVSHGVVKFRIKLMEAGYIFIIQTSTCLLVGLFQVFR